jgi:hypothetical protein
VERSLQSGLTTNEKSSMSLLKTLEQFCLSQNIPSLSMPKWFNFLFQGLQIDLVLNENVLSYRVFILGHIRNLVQARQRNIYARASVPTWRVLTNKLLWTFMRRWRQ